MSTHSPAKKNPDQNSVELILAAQGGCIESQNRLVLANMGLIIMTAGRICRGVGKRLEEWLSIGVEAFIDAIHRFKPELGYRLSTYSVSVMTQRYRDAWDERSLMRVPRNRGATSQKRIDAAKKAWRMHSLDVVVDKKGRTLKDQVTTQMVAESDEERMEKGERLAALGEAMKELTFRHRTVLQMRHRGVTLKGVAMEIGMSVERVRQIEAEGLKLLRELMGVEQ